MIETYTQAAEGKVKLTDMVTCTKTDMVQGSGIPHQPFQRWRDILPSRCRAAHDRLSDNTATNLVLDKIGIASTGERMEKLGLPNTKIHAKRFKRETSIAPERSRNMASVPPRRGK